MRHPAPKAGALPAALHPDMISRLMFRPEIFILLILFYLCDIVNNVLVKIKLCEKIFSSTQTKTQVIFSVKCCLSKRIKKWYNTFANAKAQAFGFLFI